jgi:acetylornithine/succinyldiaminopimelate/putrescine aminotransferase
VAGAVLDEILRPGVLEGVATRSQRVREALDRMGDQYGVFEPVRGQGLLLGAPMRGDWKGRAREFVNAGLRHGVWCLVAGPDVLRLAPSLIIPEADLDLGLQRLEAAVAEVAGARRRPSPK